MNISYLFDFDGTLVDSMPTFISTMLSILDENNIPMIELENGESFELQECDFSELLSIYEEVC